MEDKSQLRGTILPEDIKDSTNHEIMESNGRDFKF